MIVDGRAIATEIYKEVTDLVSHLNVRPHLTAFTCAPNFETKKYLNLKKRKAEEVGIGINVIELPETAHTKEVQDSVMQALAQTDGIVMQLPFPATIDIDSILRSIPASYDIDAIQYDGTSETILPPVVGAIKEISERYDILFAAQKVVIVGRGRLVGAPASIWAQKQGAQVTVLTRESKDIRTHIATADILILGAGVPGLVTADMIKEGVVIFDASTSEDQGELRGDADVSCAEKAHLLTPVPGGIGPITVAMLLKNLVTLVSDTNR